MIELRKIKRDELLFALIMHRIGFLPVFIKYRDKNNPVFRTYFDFWKLDTIMQEKKNCHLYEKLG